MAEYLVQLENRLQAAQVALKNDLKADQEALEARLQAAQVQSEGRMHMHNQALASALTYKVLFLGCGVAVGGFVVIEGLVKAQGYELLPRKKLIET
jgi:hypothetical protein